MNSAKPNNRRFFVVVGILLAAALVTGLVTACSGNGNDQPDSTRVPTSTTSTAQATKSRNYIAMVVDGERHAMLSFQVYPEGGQVIGKYTMVYFDGSGKEVRETTDFNGRGSDSTFQLDGLTDYGAVTGTLSGDRTRLTFDRTFGVEKTVWTIVPSAASFEAAVKQYAKRFESCSKKHEVDPCEGVA